MRHDIEVVVDRLVDQHSELRPRLAEAVEQALKLGDGTLLIAIMEDDEAEAGVSSQQSASGGGSQRRRATASDKLYSTRYACADCALSFEPPSPQLFSFNSPQGMCPSCDGLGQLYSFDPELLVPDPQLSFKKGCIRTARFMEGAGALAAAHLSRAWRIRSNVGKGCRPARCWRRPGANWERRCSDVWLWGTGDRHITYTWRGGASPMKYGGKYEGMIPELLGKYRTSRSRPQLRKLEKYMRTLPCSECDGQRLVRQARYVRVASRHPAFGDQPSKSLPEVCRLAMRQSAQFFDELELDETGQVDCRRSAQGDPQSARVPAECRAGLPDAGTYSPHICQAASRSGFDWQARSAPDWLAYSISSTSLRSACIRATTSRLLDTLASSARHGQYGGGGRAR